MADKNRHPAPQTFAPPGLAGALARARARADPTRDGLGGPGRADLRLHSGLHGPAAGAAAAGAFPQPREWEGGREGGVRRPQVSVSLLVREEEKKGGDEPRLWST